MSNFESLEQLVALRDKLLQTIQNLEFGLFQERRKVNEFEFYRDSKEYDRAAMDEQAERSRENVRQIETVLLSERAKLSSMEERIVASKTIIVAHGRPPCLTGAIPHEWDILERHASGKFRHRKCRCCGTDEKVGY